MMSFSEVILTEVRSALHYNLKLKNSDLLKHLNILNWSYIIQKSILKY